MNKNIFKISIIVLFLIIGYFGYLLVGANKTNTGNISNINTQKEIGINTEKNEIKSEKIEIILFHATQRCYSCNKMGELIKKTLEEKFKTQLDSGKIIFKELNRELPENISIVSKYGATGLSVFINSIKNGVDDIKQETSMWRMLEDEEKFKTYLSDKINSL